MTDFTPLKKGDAGFLPASKPSKHALSECHPILGTLLRDHRSMFVTTNVNLKGIEVAITYKVSPVLAISVVGSTFEDAMERLTKRVDALGLMPAPLEQEGQG